MKSLGNRMGLKPKPDWLGADRELEQELKEVERRILHQASLFDPGAETYVRYALEGEEKGYDPHWFCWREKSRVDGARGFGIWP